MFRRANYAIAKLALALSAPFLSALPAIAPAPIIKDPGRGPRFKEPRANSMSKRRRAFIDAHNRNPLNFLPGSVVTQLNRPSRNYKTQRDMERMGHRLLLALIEHGYRPKAGYCGDGK